MGWGLPLALIGRVLYGIHPLVTFGTAGQPAFVSSKHAPHVMDLANEAFELAKQAAVPLMTAGAANGHPASPASVYSYTDMNVH